ncbi:CocE/NonD family hydrolase [Williamsia sp. M5A3_1d]
MTTATIEFDVGVPMRDGVVLRADVYRPAGDGPWPVLVQRTPYEKGSSISTLQMLDTYRAVRRGYIVVQQDIRGRHASDGEWLPLASERFDGYDTVEWAAGIPGSNGKVAMFGGSYSGDTQWAAAAARPPHLVAIAPQVTWNRADDGLFYRGGALEHGLSLWWTLSQSMAQYPRDASDPEELSARLGRTAWDFDNLADVTYWELPSGDSPAVARTGQPDFGTQRGLADPGVVAAADILDRIDDVAVPSLNVAGWFDVFCQGAIDNYVAARAAGNETRLIIGPWEHTTGGTTTPGHLAGVNYGVSSMAPGADGTMTGVELEWFDHHLSGAPLDAEKRTGVDVFVMGANQWRHEEEWPLQRAVPTAMYLHPGGVLSDALPTDAGSATEYDYDPADPAPTTGGGMFMAASFPAGSLDQAAVEARDDVLVFTSAPLAEDMEITGRVTATIFASTDGPSTDWVARLCDVDESGRSVNIVDGVRRVDAVSGRIDATEIDMWSTSIVIASGHRLRVQITSSNFPRWDRNLNTGESPTTGTRIRVAHQTVHHDAAHLSRIVLPVIPT